MPPSTTKGSTRKPAEVAPCPRCGKVVNKRGLAGHQRSDACRAAQSSTEGLEDRITDEDRAYDELLRTYVKSNTYQPPASSSNQGKLKARHNEEDLLGQRHAPYDEHTDFGHVNSEHESESVGQTDTFPPAQDMTSDDNRHQPDPCPDDIKVEYHPMSERTEKVFHFEDYNSGPEPTTTTSARSPPVRDNRPPYHPFRTLLDFELAEFMLDAHLNESQKATLLSLIHRSVANPEHFTIKDKKDLKACWDHARELKATGFQTKVVPVPYKGENIEFEVAFRPIWEWCLDLLDDPKLLPKFKWDAERHYKYDAPTSEWIRFIDEPWTADAWWDAQSRLPKEGASIFCIILYADKTRLSSFGTQKGYPVMARCGNLPVDLRNGEGVGGARIVGFLPIVDEDAGETLKKGFVNFKRVVWHKSFYEIIKSLEQYAKTGFFCSHIRRWIFPIILILSADYEEQCVMALVRGSTSNYPCPICLVPRAELCDLSKCYPLRSQDTMESIYDEATVLNVTEGDALLKSYGLRNVENIFWKMQSSDVYRALSFDRLHNNHGGFFSDHLWEQFMGIINDLGKPTAALVDERVDKIPRWRGMNHFIGVMKAAGEFSDGTKYEDISKILIFASEDILTPEISEQGFRLLELMRSYLELDMYTSLTVHTDKTLQAGEEELAAFCKLLMKYADDYPDKSWNFPKAHAFRHVFDDIRNKGATRNYNTKPFEKAHAILKLFYQLHTNFKDVIPQISKLNEADIARQVIRASLDYIKEMNEEIDNREKVEPTVIGTKHVSLGSPSPSISFAEMEKQFSGDTAFTSFRTKLMKTMTSHLNKNIQFDKQDLIIPYKYLKVNYESKITWREETDILRINPKFHNKERYDYALVQVDAALQTHIFCQLLQVVGVKLGLQVYYMALVLPLDETIPVAGSHRTRDKRLRLTRIRSRHRSKATFINVESIV